MVSLFSLSIIIGTAYTFNLIQWIWGDTTINSWNRADNYIISDTNAQIDIISQISTEYINNNHRFTLEHSDTSATGFITSEQYGDFYINNILFLHLYATKQIDNHQIIKMGLFQR